jgi:hypothetical protein
MAALLSGCVLIPWMRLHRPSAADKALAEYRRRTQPVGRVALVNEEQRFALIETTMSQVPAVGATLRTYAGSGISAELRTTAVRRRPYLVADLVSGTPAKGDLVILPSSKEPTPPKAVSAAEQAEKDRATRPVPAWKRWLGFFGRRK